MIQENDFKKQVAKNLVYYRKLNKMTQNELAQKLNYSDKAISKWERGENLPDLYILQVLWYLTFQFHFSLQILLPL